MPYIYCSEDAAYSFTWSLISTWKGFQSGPDFSLSECWQSPLLSFKHIWRGGKVFRCHNIFALPFFSVLFMLLPVFPHIRHIPTKILTNNAYYVECFPYLPIKKYSIAVQYIKKLVNYSAAIILLNTKLKTNNKMYKNNVYTPLYSLKMLVVAPFSPSLSSFISIHLYPLLVP